MSKDTPRKNEIHIKMLKIIQEYNSYMGGVALLDKQISLYHVTFKSKKWLWPKFTLLLHAAHVNTWRAYQTAKRRRRGLIIGCTEENNFSMYKQKSESTHLNTVFRGYKLLGGRVSIDMSFNLGTTSLYQSPHRDVYSAQYTKKTTRICRQWHN
jgi:hypothetical protein